MAFKKGINSRKSTDKVVSNALEYGDSKACNDATDADKRALKGEMGKLIKCFTGVFEVMKRIDQARAEKAFGSFANISSLFRRELM